MMMTMMSMTMMMMVTQVHRGVRGVVKDSAGEPVEGATVIVNQVWLLSCCYDGPLLMAKTTVMTRLGLGIMVMITAMMMIMALVMMMISQEGLGLLRKNVTTSSRGEFWRLLMPGGLTDQGFQLELSAFLAPRERCRKTKFRTRLLKQKNGE